MSLIHPTATAQRGDESLQAVVSQAFNCLSQPLAVIEADRRLVFANSAMQDHLLSASMIGLRNGYVVGTNSQASFALSRLLGSLTAGSPAASAAVRCGDAMLRAAVLDPSAPDGSICMALETGRCGTTTARDLALLFGLTRCEALVGLHLASGLTLEEVGARLGVSKNTVRTHVSHISQKLGVHSARSAAAMLAGCRSPFAW